MSPRRYVTVAAKVAIALLVVLAGCSGLLGGGSSVNTDGTVTPAPVPTETKTTETPAVSPPPGFEQRRLTDPYDAIRAHRALLSARSYTFVERVRTFVDGERVDYRRVIRVENATEYAKRTVWSTVGTCTYSAPIGWYNRFDPDGSADSVFSYDPDIYGGEAREDARDRFVDISGFRHADLFRGEGANVSIVERNGSTLFKTVFGQPPNTIRSKYENITDFRGVAYVEPDGFVRRVQIIYRVPVNGSLRRIERVSVYTDVGSTTVETPAWVNQIQANRTFNGSVRWNVSSDSPLSQSPCFGSNTSEGK